MKIISKTIKFLPLFLLALVITSCNNDDDNTITDPTPLNIVEIASTNANLSSLVAALQAADGDLVNVLNGNGPFTVLAPTNEAFATFLSDNGFSSLDAVPTDVLSQVLLNHVISEDLTSSDLIGLGSGYTNTNATGAGGNAISIYFNTSNGVRFNDVSSVTDGGADIDASNGTIHIIEAVIGLPSIVDHATANPNFTSLAGALTSEGLVMALQADGPFTVLAPTNDAFSDFTNPNSNALSSVLLNHVVNGALTSNDLVGLGNGYSNTLASGPGDNVLSLYFNTDSGVIFNGVSSVATADIIATNGIIHAVDAVIDIPTVVTFATADPNFSTLVTALTTLTPATDFVATLSTANGTSPAPFTVFAPTNDAFDALAAIPAEDVLTQVLLHHVLGDANVTSSDLTDGISPTMLNGQAITINLPGTGTNIADVTDGAGNTDIGVVAVDVQAGNGVIHVVNKVMLPSLD
ncbi:fasciclin domain-containing protein [Psychroserpens sp. AS72]|uniref:fasciclin domain-containing protein n=1 Tax=Psychroserpens sp. AS72 TaxID=3135775 RepID=UPI00316C8BBC